MPAIIYTSKYRRKLKFVWSNRSVYLTGVSSSICIRQFGFCKDIINTSFIEVLRLLQRCSTIFRA